MSYLPPNAFNAEQQQTLLHHHTPMTLLRLIVESGGQASQESQEKQAVRLLYKHRFLPRNVQNLSTSALLDDFKSLDEIFYREVSSSIPSYEQQAQSDHNQARRALEQEESQYELQKLQRLERFNQQQSQKGQPGSSAWRSAERQAERFPQQEQQHEQKFQQQLDRIGYQYAQQLPQQYDQYQHQFSTHPTVLSRKTLHEIMPDVLSMHMEQRQREVGQDPRAALAIKNQSFKEAAEWYQNVILNSKEKDWWRPKAKESHFRIPNQRIKQQEGNLWDHQNTPLTKFSLGLTEDIAIRNGTINYQELDRYEGYKPYGPDGYGDANVKEAYKYYHGKGGSRYNTQALEYRTSQYQGMPIRQLNRTLSTYLHGTEVLPPFLDVASDKLERMLTRQDQIRGNIRNAYMNKNDVPIFDMPQYYTNYFPEVVQNIKFTHQRNAERKAEEAALPMPSRSTRLPDPTRATASEDKQLVSRQQMQPLLAAPDSPAKRMLLQRVLTQGGMNFSGMDVSIFNVLPKEPTPELAHLHNLRVLQLDNCDLRGPGLGNLLQNTPNLSLLHARGGKIGALDVKSLPESLRQVDLRSSVVPYPVQQQLLDKYGPVGRDPQSHDQNVWVGVALDSREDQIANYEKKLDQWAQDRAAWNQGEERGKAHEGITRYLHGKTDSPAVSGYNISAFDDDFYAMIAHDRLTQFDLSGNRLGADGKSLDLAAVALSPNLRSINLQNNQIADVQNAQALASLPSLQSVNLEQNALPHVPDGLEHAPDACTTSLCNNPLTTFGKIDAKLLSLQKTLGGARREQRTPAVMTDPITSDQTSLRSYQFAPGVLDDIEEHSGSIQKVEEELENLRVDRSLDPDDIDKHEQRWREVGDQFAMQAYAQALERVITSQGGPLKSGRMQRYHQSSEQAAAIACNRSLALHQLPGQPDVVSDTAPGLKTAKFAARATGAFSKFIPVPGASGAVGVAAQTVGLGIDVESARRFNSFHSDLLKRFRPSELQTLSRVVPLAMTLMMGRQLESETPVNEGRDRHNDPAQKVIDYFKSAIGVEENAPPETKRAFRDTAHLFADIASGAAFQGVDRATLESMPFEEKVETALQHCANRNNSAQEQLSFKDRYVLYNPPLTQQLELIAANYTQNDLEQGKQIRSLRGEVQDLQGQVEQLSDQLTEEKTKRHRDKRSARATKQVLIEQGFPLQLSPWSSDSEAGTQEEALWGSRGSEAYPPPHQAALTSARESLPTASTSTARVTSPSSSGEQGGARQQFQATTAAHYQQRRTEQEHDGQYQPGRR